MNIRGFYEGSLIYGYRFRDTTYDKLKSQKVLIELNYDLHMSLLEKI